VVEVNFWDREQAYYQNYADYLTSVTQTFENYVYHRDVFALGVEEAIEWVLESHLPICEQDMLGVLRDAPLALLQVEPVGVVSLPNKTTVMCLLVSRLTDLTREHLHRHYTKMRFDERVIVVSER